MTRHNDGGSSLASVALVCAALAFPLWLLSFSWVPFAVVERPLGSARHVIVAAEVGALLASLLGAGLGASARRRSRAGTAGRRRMDVTDELGRASLRAAQHDCAVDDFCTMTAGLPYGRRTLSRTAPPSSAACASRLPRWLAFLVRQLGKTSAL